MTLNVTDVAPPLALMVVPALPVPATVVMVAGEPVTVGVPDGRATTFEIVKVALVSPPTVFLTNSRSTPVTLVKVQT